MEDKTKTETNEYCDCLKDYLLPSDSSRLEFKIEANAQGIKTVRRTVQICNICEKERGQAVAIQGLLMIEEE